jgi:chemotaxis protein methyltransferase WspC
LILQNRAPVEPKTESVVGIGAAALLADQGRLAEAEKSCLQHIREQGASAQALYLMGLIRDAGGSQEEAVHYYRKALYLDQDHQDALGHLALLLRKQGDMTGARLLRDRLKRAERKGT